MHSWDEDTHEWAVGISEQFTSIKMSSHDAHEWPIRLHERPRPIKLFSDVEHVCD